MAYRKLTGDPLPRVVRLDWAITSTTLLSAEKLCPLRKTSQCGSAAAIPPVVGSYPTSALRGFTEIEGVRRGRMADAVLKWPNDVLIGERKLAGILAQRVDAGVIVGIGLNVGLRAGELPVPTATSLAIEGAPTDRDPLLRAILREIATRHEQFRTDEAAVRRAYRELCNTIGRHVRVELPGDEVLVGEATGVEEAGRLVINGVDGEHLLSAGDVVHVR